MGVRISAIIDHCLMLIVDAQDTSYMVGSHDRQVVLPKSRAKSEVDFHLRITVSGSYGPSMAAIRTDALLPLLVGKRQPAPQSVFPKLDAELVVQLGDRIAAGHEHEQGALWSRLLRKMVAV